MLDIGADGGIVDAYSRLIYPDIALVCVESHPATHAILERNATMIGNCQVL